MNNRNKHISLAMDVLSNGFSECLTLSGTLIVQPCVYGWFRDNQCLYVGASTNGIGRCFSRAHQAIGKRDVVKGSDTFKIIPVPNRRTMHILERTLINKYKPPHNRYKAPLTYSPLQDVS